MYNKDVSQFVYHLPAKSIRVAIFKSKETSLFEEIMHE